LKILVDMNLSPEWTGVLEGEGFQAVHWSVVGDPRAIDEVILEWALSNGHVLLTKDLDFGAILAASRAAAPSVLQVRAQDVTPSHLSAVVVSAIRRYADHLHRGALISLDETSHRARILPLRE
jgi:predicted nuclease of predicted toxin-antitoxin system